MSQSQPTVSVIIPARNAEEWLRWALESIAAQTYPNIIEVIVAAADPGTVAAAGNALVVHNPEGSTPAGLNLAINASSGDVIVRCDAHSVLPAEYVAQAVETLERTGADNVGGMQVPVGRTPWEKAVAAAMTSPLGSGNARYRLGGDDGPVETVYLGVFSRKTLDRLGGYDEAFTKTQDYELNHRIISSGGIVWFDSQLRVEYRPRGTLRALAQQYLSYGRAKRQFVSAHPGSLRLRQLAPPILVGALVATSSLALIYPPWAAVILFYLVGVLTWCLLESDGVGLLKPLKAVVLVIMHMSWGFGFLLGDHRRRGLVK